MDAIIVGAGIIGSSIAWRLAQRGVKVTLIDRGPMGAEASYAGAGMLAPGGEYDGHACWAKMAVRSLAIYPKFVRELEDASGMGIDFRVCGALEFCKTAAAWDELTEKAARQEAIGIPSTIVGRSEVARMAPLAEAEGWAGVRHYPSEAEVDPRTVLRALGKVLEALGVVILEEHRVDAISERGSRICAGSIEADVAVLAAGAWSSQIALNVAEPLPQSEPVKGHLLGYQLAAQSLGPILRCGHTYILQRKNGYTIAGATTEHVGFDRTLSAEAAAQIAIEAKRLLPDLARAGKPDLWNGIRPGIASGEPQVGRIGNLAVWAAYGHYRNGILLAPTTAEMIAAGILDSGFGNI